MEQAPTRSGGSPSIGRSAPARLLTLSIALTFIAAACSSSPRIEVRGPSPTTESERPSARVGDDEGAGIALPATEEELSAVSLFPLKIPQFIFGQPIREPRVQSGSQRLISVVERSRRLHIAALPSADDTAAVNLLEDARKGQKWGEVMTPAQRRIFATFARDATLGEWLVIVDDVNVIGAPDPVPMTAYRWHREDVEGYASCGIPPSGIDQCTAAFYHQPEMLYVLAKAHTVGA